MNIVELIEKKKLGKVYSYDDLKCIVNGYCRSEIPDYQMSAILMAIYFSGMNIEETTNLTDLIIKSGKTLDLSTISDEMVDKHSTGGVGDKITLILLALFAAAGVYCAKLSGRGLGYTGGTIDKLMSIPNFNCDLSSENFYNIVKKNYVAISAQNPELTPADGKIYALRDVTSTVDVIPLIASSIISKKIASGANHILLDVKCGEGSFSPTLADAVKLSETMVAVGKNLNKNITAIITDMNIPLGRAVGNALEVIEVIEFLKGNTVDDLEALSYEFAATALIQMNRYENKSEAITYLKELVFSGKALLAFKNIIENQNGDSRIIDDYNLLPQAMMQYEVKSQSDGFVANISALKIAKASKLFGAGRTKKGDSIDYSVGIYLNKKYGEKVCAGETLATLYYNSEINFEIAKELVEQAYELSQTMPLKQNMIYKIIKNN